MDRAKQTVFYEETHSTELIKNALLCHECHNELNPKTHDDPGVESMCRKFSRRNGFGPVIAIPRKAPEGFNLTSPVVPMNTPLREQELRYVLSQLTVAEESAIRRVAPLASIVRLKHGNVGRKGTVSCVWQDNKPLLRVLPALPSECKTLVIRYDQKNGKLSSFRCRRHWIARALRLLKATEVEPWANIVIDVNRLKEWPVEGNLMDLVPKVDVTADAENDNGATNREDDSSLGPAPGQNHECRDVEFVGLVMNNEQVDATANAVFANQELQDFGSNSSDAFVTGDVDSPVACNHTSLPTPVDPMSPTIACNVGTPEGVNGSVDTTGFHVVVKLEEPQLPKVDMSKGGQRAALDSLEVLPKGDFVNMKSTPWAWAMSFPTLFPPMLGIDGKWASAGDPTAFHTPRDFTPSLSEWGANMMWRNDGGPARHPTFALILNAEITQQQLRSQGLVFLSRMNISPSMSVKEFQEDYADPEKRRHYHENLQHSAGNVRGTDQYWKSVRNKFKAAIFYLQYVKKKEMRYFVTGSQAEYHDPFLRRVLAKYVGNVESEEAGCLVLSSQDHWFKAVMNYKNVVTNFFAFKNEQWYGHFLKHTLGVNDFQGRLEFTKARGAIHSHGSCASDSLFDKAMDSVLSDLALEMYEVAKMLEQGLIKQKEFDSRTSSLANLSASRITNLMERSIGISASHVGKPPSEWVAPAGRTPECGHRRSTKGMLDMSDVVKTQGLRKFKFDNENELYRRKMEITNICLCHTCSSYCWRNRHVQTAYIPAVHDDNPLLVRVVPDKKGTGSVAVMRCEECRMGYGFSKTYPSHNCRTGGKAAVREPLLEFDRNGQPKLCVPRNHPRTLMEPVHVYHWGANADIQRFMNNAMTFQAFLERYEVETDSYNDFCMQLEKHGMRGLESASGCNTANDYTCNYQCKGAASTADWSKCLRVMEQKLMECKQETPLRSLVGKSMHLIAKSRDCSKDEASFMLSGGHLYFTSQPVKMCSLSTLELSDIGDVDGDPKSFTFESVRKRYERRDGLRNVGLFKWAAQHAVKGKEIAPHFTGFQNYPSWPLEEGYSKNILQLYKPYFGNFNHEGFNSFSDALLDFLDNGLECPIEIARSVRAKRERYVMYAC